MRLTDGRQLGWVEYGDPAGRPLVVLHGTPGCGQQIAPLDAAATAAGVRLIAPDRPGFGDSDPHPLSFTGYVDDLRQLLDHLDLEQVSLAGVSGGGGYALAAAALAPERLTQLLLVSAMVPQAPPDTLKGRLGAVSLFFRLARTAPWLLGKVMAWQASSSRSATPKGVPAQDRRVVTDAALKPLLDAASAHAFRQGPRAAVSEAALYSGPGGFRLTDITVPTVVLHGTEDANVPCTVATWVAMQLPHAELVTIADGGHLFAIEQPEELLSRA